MQNALETCTEEEAEQERPELKQKLLALAGAHSKKSKEPLDVDKILEDKDDLKEWAQKMLIKSKKLAEFAKADVESLRDEKVCQVACSQPSPWDGVSRL
jgi:uncharacterized ferredoxin-like protein